MHLYLSITKCILNIIVSYIIFIIQCTIAHLQNAMYIIQSGKHELKLMFSILYICNKQNIIMR